MKRYLIIWPLLALLCLNGCLGAGAVGVVWSITGIVTDLPNPNIHGPLTLALDNGEIVDAFPVLPLEELDVFPVGLYAFKHASIDPEEPYSVAIINQPNGYTCSFETDNDVGVYGDVPYVNLICVAD